MKKILSLLVLSALLLTALSVAASAATYFDYGDNLNPRITVRKSDSVVIDGVISDGEYEEYTDGYSEWYVGEEASEYFDDAENMAKTAQWYFSWDGKYLNIAAKWNAGRGANQLLSGGDYYGDYAYVDTDEFVIADNCLGYGPGINIVSSEISSADEEWQRFYYAVSENTATGEKITGTFSSQNGQNFDYKASHDDFEFTYSEDGWVTAEYRIPIIELYESFKEDQGGQMFKAAVVLTTGIAGIADELSNDWVIPYSWGVRLGQYGYASDSGNTEKTWATFRLVDPDDLPPEPGPGPTPEPPVTTPDETPKKTPDETPVVTPSETPDETPKVTPLETPDPETPDVTPDPETPDNTPDAPPTGDIMVVAAALSAISACGVMIAKKRR